MKKTSEKLAVVSEQPVVATAAAKAIEVVDISLEQLEPSRNNARRTMDEAGLKELAASIREHGVQVPLLVRHLWRSVWVEFEDGTSDSMQFATMAECSELLKRPGALKTEVSDGYQIVAGHRRCEAARIAGLSSVPCIVRELTDDEAAERGIVDNIQRVDVPPIEEAEALGELHERAGSIQAVAAKVGKEIAYVAKSLKLLTLTTWSREALRQKLITIDHARLLARVAEAEQNEALKWCLDRNAGSKTSVDKVIAEWLERRKPDPDDDDDEPGHRKFSNYVREPESVQRLKEHIECESGIPLDRAPWPMEEDWLLPDAGSCLDCPKNTKANAPLFGDLDIGVAVCTDGACFKAKVEGFVQMQIRDAAKEMSANREDPRQESEDFEILRVSWKTTLTVPRQLKDGGGVNPAQTFKDGQWEEATKKCEHARSAVTVDWSDANNRGYMGREEKLRKPGEIVQACIESRCEAHPKAYENHKATSTRSKTEKRDPAAEARAKATADHREKHEEAIRKEVMAALVEKLTPASALRIYNDNSLDSDFDRKRLRKEWPKASPEQIEALVMLAMVIANFSRPDGEQLLDSKAVAEDRKQLWGAAKTVGVDANAIAAAHFWKDGSIAPASDVLYPQNVPWPKDPNTGKSVLGVDARPTGKPAPRKAAVKPAKKATPKKTLLSPAVQNRLAAKKSAAKKAVRK